VFVTGEPGIGKTTLVEAFAAQIQREENQKAKGFDLPAPSPQPLAPALVARGQCIEQYGTGEPDLPVLEALGRLARTPDGDYFKKGCWNGTLPRGWRSCLRS
jgi:predicted ATPase